MSIRIFTILVLCGLLRPDAYTEEEAKKASSTCSPSLVRDQRWPKEERHSDVELDLDNSESASLTRPTVPVASSCCLQNYSSHGSTGMEMRSLQNYESQKSGILPNLHAATSALGRARRAFQEASEARKQLKNGWMKHLEESLAAWEKQLENYRSSYAQLQDAESKALQDVANAKRSIQQLNSQSGSSGAEDQALVEEMVDMNGEKEEEKAKQRLQAIMQSCMVSVGVEVKHPEIMEIHSDTERETKRQRSAEPTLAKPAAS